MSPRYIPALERIRAILAARSQAEPLIEAEEIRAKLGGWPSTRTIQRYIERIRSGEIDVQRQTMPADV